MTATGRAWQCPPATVLAAVDFGEASSRAVGLAGVLASASGGRLRVLHAERFEPPPYFTLEQIERLEAERLAAQAEAARLLARFAADATSYPVEPAVVDEPPVDAVLGAADGVDLIVAGTHGRRGPGRWWLGSVAERIVRGAHVPVLVTRSAASPVLDVFARVALVGGDEPGAGDARAWAQYLVATFGGSLVEAGDATHCTPASVDGATLVVVAATAHPGGPRVADTVGRVLQACRHPVLFVPPRSRDDGGVSPNA